MKTWNCVEQNYHNARANGEFVMGEDGIVLTFAQPIPQSQALSRDRCIFPQLHVVSGVLS